MTKTLQQRLSAKMPKNATANVAPLLHPKTGEVYVQFNVGDCNRRPWYIGHGYIDPDATDSQIQTFLSAVTLDLVVPTPYPETISLGSL